MILKISRAILANQSHVDTIMYSLETQTLLFPLCQAFIEADLSFRYSYNEVIYFIRVIHYKIIMFFDPELITINTVDGTHQEASIILSKKQDSKAKV